MPPHLADRSLAPRRSLASSASLVPHPWRLGVLPRVLLGLALPLIVGLACRPAAALGADEFWQAAGLEGAVVAGGPGPEAAAAGLAVLQEGGNAVDSAATMLLVLCVIDPGNFCFGGEVPWLVYDGPRRVVEVVAGQGVAPQLATRTHFDAQGKIPPTGVEPAAVPAALDAILTALDRYGTISLARAAQPMLAVLDARTETWHRDLARTMRELIAAERQATDRRQGLRLAADYFYRGPIARRIDSWSRANGGLLRYADLATHVTRIEQPVSISYRGYTVVKCGIWTQGPMLLQSLQLLSGFDFASLHPAHADQIHLTVEALKLALADRDTHYGDPLFSDIPLAELLSTSYADTRRTLIDRSQASREWRPGAPRGAQARLDRTPPAGDASGRQRDTTTCLVADRFGNVVAATPSGWGGVVAGDTGVHLGSRLRSLTMEAGHPNEVAPGKRPRITLTPTLVLQQSQPVLAISVAGGDLQDQVSLQLLLACLDFHRSPAEAVTLPRFSTAHHIGSFSQPPPQLGSLTVNPEVTETTLERLRQLGHQVTVSPGPIGHPSVLRIDPATGRKEAAGDPRTKRHARAY
ncbi:MAG: gamma-glutamyltransferase [Pirellulales bacterium]